MHICVLLNSDNICRRFAYTTKDKGYVSNLWFSKFVSHTDDRIVLNVEGTMCHTFICVVPISALRRTFRFFVNPTSMSVTILRNGHEQILAPTP